MGQHSVREDWEHGPCDIGGREVGNRAHRLNVGWRSTELDPIRKKPCRAENIRSLSPTRGRFGRHESITERAFALDARTLRTGAEAKPHAADRAPDGARAGPCHVGGRPDELLVGDESIGVSHKGRQNDELEM